jgi:hypothetical protein
MTTSLKAPNKANTETFDFDNQIPAQIRESTSLNLATVTLLRAAEPCNKKISFNDTTGALEKIPLAHIDYAEAISHEVVDAASLRSLLETVSKHPDLTITLCSFNGIPAKEPFTILSARKMRERLGLPENSATPDKAVQFDGKYYTTREKKNCIPSSWACFDYDKVKDMPEKLIATSPEDWLRMMGDLLPGFNEADKVLVGSSSSRVSYHDAPAFDGGWHCFVQVKDADDVEDFGKRLLIHSLTTEYGFMRKIFSNDTGQVVGHRPWTIFDPTTFSRERLLFEGKPVVDGRGLAVLPAAIKIIGGKS